MKNIGDRTDLGQEQGTSSSEASSGKSWNLRGQCGKREAGKILLGG